MAVVVSGFDSEAVLRRDHTDTLENPSRPSERHTARLCRSQAYMTCLLPFENRCQNRIRIPNITPVNNASGRVSAGQAT